MRKILTARNAAICLLLAPLASFAQSQLIISQPIPLTGGGSWFNSLGDFGASANASGTTGADWANFSYSCYGLFGQAEVGATVGLSGACSGSASLGDDTGSIRSNYFSVSIWGDGGGSLELLDFRNDLMASVPLIGYIVPLWQQYSLPFEGQGTFAVVPSPEPGTILLVATAGLAIAIRRRPFPGKPSRLGPTASARLRSR
ncbi:MAG TPA: PEP-CTERM sorting domain-containing protein [Bryobacteraceae bacterium]|nr:PEP-CTERM sorting domain-containing protein [Bryobacteraceae bacterium]